MPKPAVKSAPEKSSVDFIIDRTLMVGGVCAATAYIVRGTWPAMFFEASAILIGVMWCFRVITTHPERNLRLMAALVLVLLWSLMAFYLGAAKGLL